MNISSIELEVGLFVGMQKAAIAIVSTRVAAQWNETTTARPLAALRRWVVLMQPADCVYIITLNRLSLFVFFSTLLFDFTFLSCLLPFQLYRFEIQFLRYGTMLFIYSLHPSVVCTYQNVYIRFLSFVQFNEWKKICKQSERNMVLVGAEAGEGTCASNSFLGAFKMRNLSLR